MRRHVMSGGGGRAWRAGLLTAAMLGLSACAHERAVVLPGPPRSQGLDALLRAHPLPADRDILPVELARGANASLFLVQIRTAEAPHRHPRYDLTVTLVRGHGVLWLDGAPQAMRAGDVAFVPRGLSHHFVTESATPAVALVAFAPAFDGPDAEPAPVP